MLGADPSDEVLAERVARGDVAAFANDNTFASTAMKPGDTFAHTFTKAGSYLYFCSLHPEQMRARIDVKD